MNPTDSAAHDEQATAARSEGDEAGEFWAKHLARYESVRCLADLVPHRGCSGANLAHYIAARALNGRHEAKIDCFWDNIPSSHLLLKPDPIALEYCWGFLDGVQALWKDFSPEEFQYELWNVYLAVYNLREKLETRRIRQTVEAFSESESVQSSRCERGASDVSEPFENTSVPQPAPPVLASIRSR